MFLSFLPPYLCSMILGGQPSGPKQRSVRYFNAQSYALPQKHIHTPVQHDLRRAALWTELPQKLLQVPVALRGSRKGQQHSRHSCPHVQYQAPQVHP